MRAIRRPHASASRDLCPLSTWTCTHTVPLVSAQTCRISLASHTTGSSLAQTPRKTSSQTASNCPHLSSRLSSTSWWLRRKFQTASWTTVPISSGTAHCLRVQNFQGLSHDPSYHYYCLPSSKECTVGIVSRWAFWIRAMLLCVGSNGFLCF